MVIFYFALSSVVFSYCSCFSVTRLPTGDLFTNPTCNSSICNSTYQANTGCTTWDQCCFCKCWEFYSYRSDLGRCLGADKALHLGCKYRFADKFYEDANLKVVTLQPGSDNEIGKITILPTHPRQKNLGSSCSINKEQSGFLVNGQWKTFGTVSSNNFFIMEGKTVNVSLKWKGNDSSPYEGLIIKLDITCTKAGKSCLVFKVSGTANWTDIATPTVLSSTNDETTVSAEVVSTGQTTEKTDGPSHGSTVNKNTNNDKEQGEVLGGGDKAARETSGGGKESNQGEIKTALIGAGAAILCVLFLTCVVYRLTLRKRKRRDEQNPEPGTANTSQGFSSAAYQDSDTPVKIPRNDTYEKPPDPIYDELPDAVGNPVYGVSQMSTVSPVEKSQISTVTPVEKSPVQETILKREPSEKDGVNNSRPLPKTPDQIIEEYANAGGYTPLSCSIEKSSPLHAENPVYTKPEPRPENKKTGHHYAVLENGEVKKPVTVTEKSTPCHDYAVLESEEEKRPLMTNNDTPKHDYAVLESEEETNLSPVVKPLVCHDYSVLENNKESRNNYEKLILESEPSPYQSLL